MICRGFEWAVLQHRFYGSDVRTISFGFLDGSSMIWHWIQIYGLGDANIAESIIMRQRFQQCSQRALAYVNVHEADAFRIALYMDTIMTPTNIPVQRVVSSAILAVPQFLSSLFRRAIEQLIEQPR